MEILIMLVGVVGFLVVLDLAALRWGVNQRQNDWLAGNYDPRNDWNVFYPTTPTSQKPSLPPVQVRWADATDVCISVCQN